jgi:hypothetical protein
LTTLPISYSKFNIGLHRLAGSGVVVLAALLAINTPLAQSQSSAPKVVVPEYRHDFGEIFAGQFMDHIFTIRNDGTAPLKLSDEAPHSPKASSDRPAASARTATALFRGSVVAPESNAAGAPGVLVLNAAKAGWTRPGEPAPT